MIQPEVVLWQCLRGRKLGGFKFRRKAPLGRLVVDFLCPAVRLVVEVTGRGQDRRLLDLRDQQLQQAGYGVVRLTRADVEGDLDAALSHVLEAARVRAVAS